VSRGLTVECGPHLIWIISSGTRRPAGVLLGIHIIMPETHLELQAVGQALGTSRCMAGRERSICKEPRRHAVKA
jgi:hypothetical protein